MKHTRDYELRGTARVYDDLTEMVDLAWKHGKEWGSRIHSGEWVGRELEDWDAVKRAVAEPWDDALHEVRMMVEDLKGKVPPPEKITRSKAWSMHRARSFGSSKSSSGARRHSLGYRHPSLSACE